MAANTHTQPFDCRKSVVFSKYEIHLEYGTERIHFLHHSKDTASLYLLDAFRCVLIHIYKSLTHCTQLTYYLLTPRCRVLPEQLTGLQLVKKFPTFHGTRRLITALTSVRHLSLSWASPIQSIYLHPTDRRSILILSTHLRLGLPSGFFPSGFPTKTLYTPLSSPTRATMPSPSHSSRFYHPHDIG